MEKGVITCPKNTTCVEWEIPLRTEQQYGISWKSPKFRFLDTSWSLEYVPENNKVFSIYLLKDHSEIPKHSFFVQIYQNRPFGDLILASEYLQFTDKTWSCLVAKQISMDTIRTRFLNEHFQIAKFVCLLYSTYAEYIRPDTQNLETKARNVVTGYPREDFNKIRRNTSVETENTNSSEEEHKVIQNLRDLFYGEETDIILRVQGRDFRSHRAILAARSTVLAAMLKHDVKENNIGIVVIEDCDPDTFESFLEHLYTGSIKFSDSTVIRLYQIAEKYDSPDLKENCVDFMSRTMSVETFCDVAKLSLKYNDSELLQKVIDFFMKNVKKISISVQWQTFIKEHPLQANEFNLKAYEYHRIHE